jgi:hypothetical protein
MNACCIYASIVFEMFRDRNTILARIEAEELGDLPQLWMHGGRHHGADHLDHLGSASSLPPIYQDQGQEGTENMENETSEMDGRPRKVRKKTEERVPVGFYDAPEKDPRRVEEFLYVSFFSLLPLCVCVYVFG